MKKLITYLKALWSRVADSQRKDVGVISEEGAIEHPFCIHSASVGTRWKPAGKLQKVMSRMAAVVCLLVTLGVGNAWGVDVTYTLTITGSDFNTTSYAANNNEKTTQAVCTTDATKKMNVAWTSYQVMKNSSNMQWQKNKGYIYNSTDLGTINSVTVTSSAGSFTTYYGTSEQPSSGSLGSGNGYFKTSVGNATGTVSQIVINFTVSEGGTPTCATPTFSPETGSYIGTQSVTISCATDGATIYYTTDGTAPNTSSSVYSSAISVSSTQTLKAYAVKAGANDSEVGTATYTIVSCSNDNFSWDLTTNSYTTGTNEVTWSHTYATMHNTGTNATNYLGGDANNRTSSRFYSSNTLTITPASGVTISYVVFTGTSADYAGVLRGSTWTNAAASGSGTYVIVTPTTGTSAFSATVGGTCGFTSVYVCYSSAAPSQCATPTFNNGTGTYNNDVSVTISCASPSGTTIHYTTGASPTDPTCSNGSTGTSVTISSTGTTLKAIACKDDYTASTVASATYTLQCATPTISLATGTYCGSQSVTLSCTTDGATIRYTTDGGDPTNSSTAYNGSAITVSSSETLKAKAFKTNYTASDVASETYTINTPLTTMDQIFSAATSAGGTATATCITFNNWVVSGASSNGRNIYVTDGTKGFIIYKNADTGFRQGDILSGTVSCNVQLYNGAAELTELTTTTDGLTVTKGGTVTPTVMDASDIAALTGVNTGRVITTTGECVSCNSTNQCINGAQLYNQLYSYSATNGTTYTVTGVYLKYNKNDNDIQEILPLGELTTCTELASISGSFSFTSVGATGATANWSWTKATTGISKNILKIYKESDNSLVATIDNISASATSQAITGLDHCTEYYVKLSTVSSGGDYCVGVDDQTGASHVTFTTSGYTVTSTGVTNVTPASAFPSTTCASGFSIASMSAASGYHLPMTISVTNADHTWNSSTGALTISNVTDNITITITAVENSCSSYSFHWGTTMGNEDQVTCLNFVTGTTDTYRSALWTVPTTGGWTYVGWQGGWHNDNAKSANLGMTAIPYDKSPSHNKTLSRAEAGNVGGAQGYIQVYGNSTDNNKYVGFLPAGYVMRILNSSSVLQSTKTFVSADGTIDGNLWHTSDVFELTADMISGKYDVDLKTENSYVWAEGRSYTDNVAGMKIKNGNGTYRATNIAAGDAGTRGRFGIYANSGDNNWYCHFIPYHRVIFHSNYPGGGGPADTYAGETSVEEANASIALASAPTAPTGYTFDGWYTAADGGTKVTTARSFAAGASADIELWAHWTANTISLTLNKNNSDASGSSDGSASILFDASSVKASPAMVAATRTGYTVEGYYTDVACTAANKVLDASGNVINSTVSSYTTSGKWTRATTPTTLYAKWTAEKYTVTWHVGESTATSSNVEFGTLFSALDPENDAPAHGDNALAACGSTKFIGWVKASGIYTDDGGTVALYNTHKASASDVITADTHYYAMYAEAESDYVWSKVTNTADVTAGAVYALISFDEEYYISNGESTSTPVVNAVSKTGDDINFSDAMKWNVTTLNSGFQFESYSSSGKYLWGADTNDGVRVVETSPKSNPSKEWYVESNVTYGVVIYHTANSSHRVLSTYGTQDWRNYATGSLNATNRAANLYKYTNTLTNYRTGCVVTCGMPTGLTSGSISAIGATISWTGGGNGTLSRYEYAVWVDGDTEPTSGFTSNGSNTSKALTGLYSGIKYNWKVRKVCSGDDGESRWAYSSFTTTAADLTFSVPTGVDAVAGQKSDVDLPTAGVPDACGSCWVFTGWTTAAYSANSSAPATLFPAGTKARVSGDKTLYAVYCKEKYLLINSTSDLEANENYVLTNTLFGVEFALSNTPQVNYPSSDAAISNVNDRVNNLSSGKVLYNPGVDAIWRFTGTYSSGQLYNAAADKYLNLTGSGSILSTTDNLTFAVSTSNSLGWDISSTKYLRMYYQTESPILGGYDAVTSLSTGNFSAFIYKRNESSYATSPSCDTYTVTWDINNGASTSTSSVTACEGFLSALPSNPNNNTLDVNQGGCITNSKGRFMGWSPTKVLPAQDTKPEGLFNSVEDSPEITQNTTFYAVFAQETTGSVAATNKTFTFTSKAWADEDGAWTSNQDGLGFTANQGVQVTTGATGANATTKDSYDAITKVVVTYCNNKSAGAGTIGIKVGETAMDDSPKDASYSSGEGRTLRTLEFTPASPATSLTGKVTITVTCSTNSVYIYSVQIFYTGSTTTYTGYRTACCNDSHFTFGTKATPVTEYTIVREDLASASEAVEIDCNYESDNTSGAITWYSTRRAAKTFPATGAYTWTTPSSQPTGLTIDVANKKISSNTTGVWTVTISQASANNYCPADAVVTVTVKTVDKFVDAVNGNFGGDAQSREDTGGGITLPTEAEFNVNNVCKTTERRLIGWIKASDLATWASGGNTGYIDALKTSDPATNKVIAPGTRVEATGVTWYAVWGTEQ